MTTGRIAERARIPPSYLSKVLQSLRRGGLLHSQRGLGGGFQLTRSPGEITILEIVSIVDPIPRIRRCPLGIASHRDLCPLHRRLDEALAAVERAFGETTIAEILAEKEGSEPLCEVERVEWASR